MSIHFWHLTLLPFKSVNYKDLSKRSYRHLYEMYDTIPYIPPAFRLSDFNREQ